MKIYKGEEARIVCDLILRNEDYSTPIEGYEVFSTGYWFERDRWVAFDNLDGECWVEEFKTKKEAKEYCYDN